MADFLTASAYCVQVVGSMDWPYVNRYQCRVSSQPARLEILQDLYTCKRTAGGQMQHGGTIRELLIAFYQATGQKPARVIMFRSAKPHPCSHRCKCIRMPFK
jgi:hypothetical protein